MKAQIQILESALAIMQVRFFSIHTTLRSELLGHQAMVVQNYSE